MVHLGTDVPAELPPRRERPTVVTLAHLVERKRHAVVVRALAALKDRLPLDYLVIGEGPERTALERLAAELGIGDRVVFRGQLENRAALDEARRCHLFAMPGIHEPFGVAFVEAMAGGLPAIGARGEGGPEDIAAAGEGMVLVPPDDVPALTDAIERIFERSRGARRRGARDGRARVHLGALRRGDRRRLRGRARDRRRRLPMTDVLLVSLGTTHGLRIGDGRLAEQLEGAGASVEVARRRPGRRGCAPARLPGERLRRGVGVAAHDPCGAAARAGRAR